MEHTTFSEEKMTPKDEQLGNAEAGSLKTVGVPPVVYDCVRLFSGCAQHFSANCRSADCCERAPVLVHLCKVV